MNTSFESVNILGVRVDMMTMDQAVEQIEGWLTGGGGKHYIVTPNVEFIMAAHQDKEFQKVLNEADLAIPDSARLGWAKMELTQKNFLNKLLLWPLFLCPNLVPSSKFQVITGTDLMEKLCEVSAKYGLTVGFLGGRNGVAIKASECLKQKYPELKVVLAEDGPEVDGEGNEVYSIQYSTPNTDLLFVAFGQMKQEKWIAQNLSKIPVKVAMGVGGAFDYLSGSVPRAPGWMRGLGLEWLFRLIIQPWRIKRFGALVGFVWLILRSDGGNVKVKV